MICIERECPVSGGRRMGRSMTKTLQDVVCAAAGLEVLGNTVN